MISAIQKGIDAITAILGVIAGLALIYLILGTAFDLFMRYATGHGFPAILEYAEVVMVVMVYFSLAQTQRNDGHVASEILAQRLPMRLSAALEALGLALVICVLALIARQAADVAWHSYQRGEYRLGLTRAIVWPARIAIVIGFATLIAQIALRISSSLRVAATGKSDDATAGEGEPPVAGNYL